MARSETLGKSNLQVVIRLYGRTVLCTVLSLLLFFFISVIFTSLFTEVIGEYVYQLDENGQYVRDENGNPIYEIVYYDKDEPNEDGDTTTTTTTTVTDPSTTTTTVNPKQYEKFRSPLTPLASFFMNLITQIAMFALLLSSLYTSLWELGDKDSNLVAFGHKPKDVWRGLKIGGILIIPSAIVYITCVVLSLMKPEMSEVYRALYGWCNAPFLPLLNWIYTAPEGLRLALMALPLIVVPAVCTVCYCFGFRQLSVGEKIVYTKNDNR